jgi:hydrogenase-1 operon protein HyaF
MKLRDIPVVSIGPGSQPEESDGAQLGYISLPHEMAMYQRPSTPDPENVAHLVEARLAISWLQAALERYLECGEAQIANLSGIDQANRELINQILGEGEVSVRIEDKQRARIQESSLAGIWRTFYLDELDRVVLDLLEVGEAPTLARPESSRGNGHDRLEGVASPRDGVANALAIITEINEQLAKPDDAEIPYAINLSLLPMSEEDLAFLEQVLGKGSVEILSRGYGNCHVISTRYPRVWWVRYFNSMNSLILNSLEVVDLPQVVKAAREDIEATSVRLRDLVSPYWNSVN